jgi:type I restriction enzyme R subunit
MRITGDDAQGKAELDHFIDPESRYPVIVTTSKLLTTGVDAQTWQVIVIDQTIQSMTEFKQIIGRGTRINEAYGKTHFTIMDLKKATELFAAPAFDGDPVQVYEPQAGDPPLPPADSDDLVSGDNNAAASRDKYVIHDVPVHVIAERVQYYGTDGKLITESLKNYTRKTVRREYASLDQFLRTWTQYGQKKLIIEELEKLGVLFDGLAAEVGRDFDAFDLICHVAFDQPPLTRRERANNVRKRHYFARYGDTARAVLEALLEKYADEGIETLESKAVLKVPPLNRIGTPVEILRAFGGKAHFEAAIRELQTQPYEV